VRSKTSLISLAGLLAAASLSAQVTVHYINVGQAASALVEFRTGAILIDAGGETTSDNLYKKHLAEYLNTFFTEKRPDLNRTLDGVIISHPHIDHTLLLMDVMQNFEVNALIDNGADSGSGIKQLKQARDFAKKNKIQYMAVRDRSIRKTGKTLTLIEPEDPGAPRITLLAGFRGCDNANNDSIAVRIQTAETILLFTGDAENEDSKCTAELDALAKKYAGTPLLQANIYHVAHHGSFNGTTDAFMKLVSPTIAVISAGDPATKTPGQFHAFQFGHPREVAVNTVVADVAGSRSDFGGSPKDVVIFPAAKVSKTVSMEKAVYCTCWDGDVRLEFAKGQSTPVITTTNFHPATP
jgi:competence protein ComEC